MITELKATDGSALAIRDGEILETRDPRGRLLFEYDTVTGKATLHVAGTLELSADEAISLRSPRIELDARTLQARVAETRFEGKRITAEAQEVEATWGKLEQKVGRLFLWARNVYERIDGLLHTRAGRIRTEAERAYQLQADRANLVAKGDMRIQGDSINLG